MDADSDRLLTAEDELDLDLALSTEASIGGNGTDYRNSMLELEQALEEETRDITNRFDSERRPQPAGLDQALGSSNNRSRQQETPLKYASKGGGFVTGFDPLSKEEREKKANRAQRFGISSQDAVKETVADESSGMDVDEGDWKRPTDLPETPPRTAMIRLDAVHLYGTDEMSTKDVLKYFEEYGPSHVEWIDDSSCNIVFKDGYSAKRALYYQLVDQDVNFGEDEGEGSQPIDVEPARPENIATEGAPAVLVPRSKNRLQRAKDYIPVQQHNQPIIKNNKGLFLRFATDYDRKERGAAARSVYYQVHGREEDKRQTRTSRYNVNTNSEHQYGRRSRADDDEVWQRGRGIQTLSSLRRKMERGSNSPSPTRHRSWSRNRRLAGSRSRSRSRSSSRGRRSRSPDLVTRRERASRSPSPGRLRMDDYSNRGRRGDISLRLGGRITQPDIELDAAAQSRIDGMAGDFLNELESTFSRREKTIPKSRTLYSDFYEKEYLAEGSSRSSPRSHDSYGGSGSGRSDRHRRDDYSPTRSRRNSKRRDRGRGGDRDKNDALKSIEARLGLPASIDARLGTPREVAEEHVDEFGRSRRRN
ncbi:hypothetical protein BGZ94_005107 [Podila epigama]|nr:hypothetical protein BGZ94_005107 [Podila epigama]